MLSVNIISLYTEISESSPSPRFLFSSEYVIFYWIFHAIRLHFPDRIVTEFSIFSAYYHSFSTIALLCSCPSIFAGSCLSYFIHYIISYFVFIDIYLHQMLNKVTALSHSIMFVISFSAMANYNVVTTVK